MPQPARYSIEMAQEREQIQNWLLQRFQGANCTDLNLKFCIHVTQDQSELIFHLSNGSLSAINQPTENVDLTIYLPSWQEIPDILQHQQQLMPAFLQGKLRSSGHIVTTFQILYSLTTPAEGSVP